LLAEDIDNGIRNAPFRMSSTFPWFSW